MKYVENLILMFIFKISIFIFFGTFKRLCRCQEVCFLPNIRPHSTYFIDNFRERLINISIEAEYFPQQEAAVCRGSQVLRLS